MSNDPLVSIVLIFYDSKDFITEAVESVLSQTYGNWELLLVDDGSSDESIEIAKTYTEKFPDRIKYFDHHDHKNLGLSASRNLGIENSKGDLIAFLDSDDVWFAEKLAGQVDIFNEFLDVFFLYGNSLNWISWSANSNTGSEDNMRDSSSLLMSTKTTFDPPQLLELLLQNPKAVPCPSNVIVKAEAAKAVGGFNNEFTVTYDDQVFYAKILLKYKAYVSDECWIKYRIHKSSITQETLTTGKTLVYRLSYLIWLKNYLRNSDFKYEHLSVLTQDKIDETTKVLLERLDKSHKKVKRLEKSIRQKQQEIKELEITTTNE